MQDAAGWLLTMHMGEAQPVYIYALIPGKKGGNRCSNDHREPRGWFDGPFSSQDSALSKRRTKLSRQMCACMGKGGRVCFPRDLVRFHK